MASYNKAAIKKNVKDKVAILDNEVRQDLAKIFDNAMNKVDDYEDEDVDGGEIRQVASNWSEKINYALDELPSNHPLRRSGKIQSLVNKLESIVQKPDNQVTYDVMVAGGKPPAVSKQRFWSPIAKLIADAQVEVIKPSPQTDSVPYQEPAPSFAPQRLANTRRDKPQVSNIPDKPKVVMHRVPKVTEEKFSKETPSNLRVPELESGAKPGYVTNQIIEKAIQFEKYYNHAAMEYQIVLSYIQKAVVSAKDNKDSINKNISDIKRISKSDYIKDKEKIAELSNVLIELYSNLKPIAESIDDALISYGNMPNSIKIDKASPINWDEEFSQVYKTGENAAHYLAEVNPSDITSILAAYNTPESFATIIENFVKEFFNGDVIHKIVPGITERIEHYEKLGQIYVDLIAIDKDKQVYNDFMEILGDKRDSKSIRLAISQYANDKFFER